LITLIFLFRNVFSVLAKACFTSFASPQVETWGYPVLKCALI
jgi:hypothetical protein